MPKARGGKAPPGVCMAQGPARPSAPGASLEDHAVTPHTPGPGLPPATQLSMSTETGTKIPDVEISVLSFLEQTT